MEAKICLHSALQPLVMTMLVPHPVSIQKGDGIVSEPVTATLSTTETHGHQQSYSPKMGKV